MNKIYILILAAILISTNIFAQDMSVIKTDGSVEEFNISDIEDITFSETSTGKVIEGNGLKDSDLDKLRIYTQDGLQQLFVSDIDSVYYNDEGTIVYFQTDNGLEQFELAGIDSLTFETELDTTVYITYEDTGVSIVNPLALLGVSIAVSGNDVIVDADAGINYINYVLSGSTTDGMFKIYSDKKLDLVLNGVQITNQDGPAVNIQANKDITVHIEEGTTNIFTDSEEYDDPPNNEDQEAAFFAEGDLIFTGSGSMEINGFGEDQHGIKSDDAIEIHGGNITINSAVKDGIHANEGFVISGGTITITSDGDGIDGDEGSVEITGGTITIYSIENDNDALECDNTIDISDGNITIVVEGNQSKGLNSNDISISGGSITINTSGGAVLEPSGYGYDPSYCTAIKADEDLTLSSCTIIITTTGEAGRGISIDGDLTMTSGTLEITSSGDGDNYTNEEGEPDAYHGPCIKADGDFTMTGGTMTLSHSGDGGKGLSTDGQITIGTLLSAPTINITTTGNPIQITSGPNAEYAEAKTITADSTVTIESGAITISSADDGIKSKYWIDINGGKIDINDSIEGIESPNLFINGGEVTVKASDDGLNATYGGGGEYDDGSNLTVNDGYLCINATEGDALDSNGDFYMNDGVVVAHGPQSSVEVGVDVNGDFEVSGGFMVVSGSNSSMTQKPDQSSTQYSVLVKSNQGIYANTLFHIEDNGGNSLVTFAPYRRYYSIIFSSDELSYGTTYKVYTGGSSTGTEVNGLYTGGTYSGGTLRTTFTLTNVSQTVTF